MVGLTYSGLFLRWWFWWSPSDFWLQARRTNRNWTRDSGSWSPLLDHRFTYWIWVFFLVFQGHFFKHPLRWLSFFQENLKPAKILKEKKHQEMKPNSTAKRGGTPKYSQVLIKFCFDEIKKHVKHHCCKDLQKNPKETPSRMVVSWSPTHEFF